MFFKILIFLYITSTVIISVNAAGSSDAIHTETYEQWISGQFNDTFYLENTFLNKHRCFVLSGNNRERRSQYLKLLTRHNIECQGSWCINGHFECKRYDSKQCYNIEHIIDIKNSILPQYNKNIVGNIIMAYGRWNQEMGYMTWDHVETEKREIYGNYIVDQAIENIKYCHDHHFKPIMDEDGDESLPHHSYYVHHIDVIDYILGAVLLVLILVCICSAIRYYILRTIHENNEELDVELSNNLEDHQNEFRITGMHDLTETLLDREDGL